METHSSTFTGAMLDKASDEFNSNSYWNIEDILAEEEMVPCVIRVPMSKMKLMETQTYASSSIEAFENMKNGKKGIEAGTKIELPLWLALELSRRSIL